MLKMVKVRQHLINLFVFYNKEMSFTLFLLFFPYIDISFAEALLHLHFYIRITTFLFLQIYLQNSCNFIFLWKHV